jgi:diacylglycerol kinase (ATP)
LIMSFIKKRFQSFKPAIDGWLSVLRNQPNSWVHALISILVLLLAVWLDIERLEWALILLTMALVWITEFLNTAIEAVVDLASPESHPLAKMGKDIGAAAVLISALAALIIGTIIFAPRLLERWQSFLLGTI